MPPELYRKLSYQDSSFVRNNPGNNFLVFSIRINDVFDPDPLILSGSISGFKEIMQFYNNFRCRDFHLDIELANNETFPIIWGVYIGPQNVVSAVGNRDQALSVLENGLTSGTRMISAKGGIDKQSYKCSVPIATVVGDKTLYEGESGYVGTISSSPSNLLYLNVVLVSTAGVLGNGVAVDAKYTYGTHFFNRNLLLA